METNFLAFYVRTNYNSYKYVSVSSSPVTFRLATMTHFLIFKKFLYLHFRNFASISLSDLCYPHTSMWFVKLFLAQTYFMVHKRYVVWILKSLMLITSTLMFLLSAGVHIFRNYFGKNLCGPNIILVLNRLFSISCINNLKQEHY